MKTTYKIGSGKSEITPFVVGAGMMGYGQPHNTVKDVATPLSARAIFISTDKSSFVFVNIELCFVTIAMKEEIISRIQQFHPEWKLSYESILVTAQHTHAAPGGYSHYPMYNFSVPGFSPKIFETVVNGIMEAIKIAYETRTDSTLSLSEIEIPAHENVAFNRSMTAYLKNPEAKKLHPKDDWHLAVNRTMEALKISNTDGKLKSILTWFGVHATSISSFNNSIHYDNKGVAAETFEKKNPGVLAIFAQGAAGDITPNYVYDKKLKRTRGTFEDQYASAAENGEIQANYAQKLNVGKKIEGEITCVHSYIDMRVHATYPAHGVAFFQGTIEGPGIPSPLALILKKMARGVKLRKLLFSRKKHEDFYRHQGNKSIVLDHRTGEFIGMPLSLWKQFPTYNPDPIIKEFIKEAKSGAIDTLPWVPYILPLQLIRIGDFVIAGVPGEISTTAGNRLKLLLQQELGLLNVVISSYANGYMGYITTPEEYQEQCYEGGHTVYGQMTLKAVLMGFSDLAKIMKGEKKAPLETLKPLVIPEKELKLRTASL